MKELDIGMVGLGVMGQNLALNIDDKGFSVGGWDAWPEPVDALRAGGRGQAVAGLQGARRASWRRSRRPRRIIMLVKAGEVVDKTIAALRPLLEPGDMLVDGGNEYFRNTERRAPRLARGRASASSAWACRAARRARATARR